MHKLRTVGLIVATLTVGSAVAFWWRDTAPPPAPSAPAQQAAAVSRDPSAAVERPDSVQSLPVAAVSEPSAGAPATSEAVASEPAVAESTALPAAASTTSEVTVSEPTAAQPAAAPDLTASEAMVPESRPSDTPRQIAALPRGKTEAELPPAPVASAERVPPAPAIADADDASNLAALELAESAAEDAPATGVEAPQQASGVFRERPVVTARLTSQSVAKRVHFALDQYHLEAEAVATLEALLATLADADEVLKLVVDGHCDDTGSDQYNQALSEKRAAVVAEYLRDHGLVVREVIMRGHGERVPMAKGRDEQARALNRRAEIRIDWVQKIFVQEVSLGTL